MGLELQGECQPFLLYIFLFISFWPSEVCMVWVLFWFDPSGLSLNMSCLTWVFAVRSCTVAWLNGDWIGFIKSIGLTMLVVDQ